MEIIVTHDMADFDALASSVAAQKLFPSAFIVLGRKQAPAVRDFLALHKDRFATLSYQEVDPSQVTRWIVVDVRREDRLGDFAPLVHRLHQQDPTLTVHVFDHHLDSEADLPAQHQVVEPVGSATTLLVEQLRAKGLSLDALEATLLALGIHADTGSLTHPETTVRDAQALAYLMAQGAQLSMVRRYLRPPLREAQRRVLGQWLEVMETVTVGNEEVGVAAIESPERVPGLADVTSHLLALHHLPAVFTLLARANNLQVQIVARSRSPSFDVGAVLAELGGGGHPGAASAILKGWSLAQAKEKLLGALREHPPRPTRVSEVMSFPVRTVPPELRLDQLERSLKQWRHTGVPVMREGKLVGLISKRDLRQARLGGRMALPVSSCMAHHLHTTTPQASVEHALQQMVTADVGRLPVLEGEQLVGIVTRSDLLRLLYHTDPDLS